jgi:hypothetical protein
MYTGSYENGAERKLLLWAFRNYSTSAANRAGRYYLAPSSSPRQPRPASVEISAARHRSLARLLQHGTVLQFHPIAIGAGLDRPPLAFIREIPIDGAPQPVEQSRFGAKAQLVRQFVCADGIATIIAVNRQFLSGDGVGCCGDQRAPPQITATSKIPAPE